MKSQTHYQVKTQTAGQVENKNQQYLPHKWRGNTLVPVIIALAISAIATVAFLNQGANLAADNKRILAQNQISALLGEWSIVTSTNPIADVVQANLPLVENNATVYGAPLTFTPCTDNACKANEPNILFTVDTVANCNALRDATPATLTGIAAITCEAVDGANRVLRIVLN